MKFALIGAVLVAFMCGPGGVAFPSRILAAGEPVSAPAAPEAERSYLVIPETTSPDGRYAVAWALPKGPQIEWDKFRAGERASDDLPRFVDPRNEIEDNLIELKSGRKLAKVSSGYWALPEGKGSDSSSFKYHTDEESFEVAWSPPSAALLVLHGRAGGADWGSLRAFQIEAGSVVNQIECGRDLEAALIAHLKKGHRQEYERGKDHLNLRFDDLKSLGDLQFSLNGVANLENRNGNRVYRGATIKFELRPGAKGKLRVHILGFAELDLDEAS